MAIRSRRLTTPFYLHPDDANRATDTITPTMKPRNVSWTIMPDLSIGCACEAKSRPAMRPRLTAAINAKTASAARFDAAGAAELSFSSARSTVVEFRVKPRMMQLMIGAPIRITKPKPFLFDSKDMAKGYATRRLAAITPKDSRR